MPGDTIIIDSDTEDDLSLRHTRTPNSSQNRASSPDLSFPTFNELLWRTRSTSIGLPDVQPAPRASIKVPSTRQGTLRRTSSVPTAVPKVIVINSDSIHASSDRGHDSEPSSRVVQTWQIKEPIVLCSSPEPPVQRAAPRTFQITASSSPIQDRAGTFRKTTSLLDALAEDSDEMEDLIISRSKRSRPASSSPAKCTRKALFLPSSDFDDFPPPKRKSASSRTTLVDAAAKKAEREAKKAEKERTAAEKKRWQEANKLRRSKSDTMKEMLIHVDARLVEKDGILSQSWETMRGRFEVDGAELNVVRDDFDLPLIRYRRRVKARLDAARKSWVPLEKERVEEEQAVLVCLEGKDLVKLIEKQALLDTIQKLRDRLSPTHQIFLMVQGLAKFFNRVRASENRAYTARIRSQLEGTHSTSKAKPAECSITHDQADTELIRLKIAERVFVVQVNGMVDMVEWVCSVTADLSLRPYKVMRNSYLSFSVDVGRAAQTSAAESEIYRFMLQQVPRVTPHVGNAIIAEYPTLHSLYQAYAACRDQNEVDGLLQGCQISQNVNGTERAAGRRTLGPQLSKRIAAIIMGTDPLALVSGPI